MSSFGSIGALQIYILVTKDNSPCTGPQEKAAPRDISDKMPGYIMVNFSKNKNCPASEDMLSFQTCRLTEPERKVIRKHLGTCDFCSAEVEFYTHFPQPEGTVEPAPMPQPLFELAQALMNKKKDNSFFNKLMEEK